MFVDPELRSALEKNGIGYCVIGAVALGVHGFVRATAHVDLLTTDERVLAADFWPTAPDQILRGEWNEPLAGTVLWTKAIAHDVLVGRGHAAQVAVASAVPEIAVGGAPVAAPLALVLLKLEAGSALDQLDILELIAAQRVLNGAPWLAELPAHLPELSAAARTTWNRIQELLRSPAR